MLRLENWSRPAGGSPVRVSAGARGITHAIRAGVGGLLTIGAAGRPALHELGLLPKLLERKS